MPEMWQLMIALYLNGYILCVYKTFVSVYSSVREKMWLCIKVYAAAADFFASKKSLLSRGLPLREEKWGITTIPPYLNEQAKDWPLKEESRSIPLVINPGQNENQQMFVLCHRIGIEWNTGTYNSPNK